MSVRGSDSNVFGNVCERRQQSVGDALRHTQNEYHCNCNKLVAS